jgi:hypothetical protein
LSFVPTGTDQKLRSIPYVTIVIIVVNTAVWYYLSGFC